VAISTEPLVAEPDAGIAWLAAASRALQKLGWAEGLRACVEMPSASKRRSAREVEAIASALRSAPAFGSGRVQIADGPRWKLVVVTEPCPAPARQGTTAR
jgi:hypothetical protein